MELMHVDPCSECPWRADSLQGYLGGNDPLTYADMVGKSHLPPCHQNEEAYCAGACATMANMAVLPYEQDGAQNAVQDVGRREDCFKHVKFFYEYHSGQPWVPFFMRQQP